MKLNQANIKKRIKESGKRVGKDFLEAFEYHVWQRLEACIREHNGGKRTLDAAVAHFVFGGKK